MGRLDPDIRKARALVIDPDAKSRVRLVAMLKDFGVGRVDQLARTADARRVLEAVPFDIILCEYQFPGETMTGQELVDDLRQAQLLPLSTVVIMISGQATQARVAEAAEAALDAYVIKPHSEEALRERLLDARRRKRLLQPILEKVQSKAYAEAAELCNELFEARGPGWVQAARIGAELMLKLGQAQAAIRMTEAVVATKAVPWARMGIVRSDYQPGGKAVPRRTLESLLAEQPGQTDAYDVMCRMMLEQGDSPGAIDTLRRATATTPDNVPRLQKLGVLAFYYGQPEEAAEALQHANDIGGGTRPYDLLGSVLLAVLQLDGDQGRALSRSQNALHRLIAELPASPRLTRFAAVVDALRFLSLKRSGDALPLLEQMLQEVAQPAFDFEAACNTLTLLARFDPDGPRPSGLEAALQRLAERFAVSKLSTELLACAARRDAGLGAAMRLGHARISALAEEAVSLSVAGDPRAAVESLLAHAETTLNGRLLDLAGHTLHRHRAAIGETAALQARIDALRERFHSYGTQLRTPQTMT